MYSYHCAINHLRTNNYRLFYSLKLLKGGESVWITVGGTVCLFPLITFITWAPMFIVGHEASWFSQLKDKAMIRQLWLEEKLRAGPINNPALYCSFRCFCKVIVKICRLLLLLLVVVVARCTHTLVRALHVQDRAETWVCSAWRRQLHQDSRSLVPFVFFISHSPL
jgi:hypothetical protein